MPNGKKLEPEKELVAGGGCCSAKKCCGGGCCGFGKRIMLTLVGILVVYLIFFVGTLVRNNLRKYYFIGYADKMERTVMVNGTGKVTGNNDIAVTSLGFGNVDKDVSKAQADNKKVMDPLFAELKKMSIADKDLSSDYSISPEYNYTQDKGQVFVGYRVKNTVTIKIRDLKKVPAVLALAGKFGANEVGGLNFTIDDPENLKAQARDKALQDAGQKAVKLAQLLGVRLVEIVSYNEYESSPDYYPPMYAKATSLMAEGGGGSGPETVASGSRDVSMNVAITYRIVR